MVRLDMECGRGKFKCSFCLMHRHACSLSNEAKYTPAARAAALGRKLRPLEGLPEDNTGGAAVKAQAQAQNGSAGETDKYQVPPFAVLFDDAAMSNSREDDADNAPPAWKRQRVTEQEELIEVKATLAALVTEVQAMRCESARWHESESAARSMTACLMQMLQRLVGALCAAREANRAA